MIVDVKVADEKELLELQSKLEEKFVGRGKEETGTGNDAATPTAKVELKSVLKGALAGADACFDDFGEQTESSYSCWRAIAFRWMGW